MTNQEGRRSAGFVPEDERLRLRAGFGEALCRARRAAGLTGKELAKRTGLSVSHVYALEAGARRTRPVTIAMLARVLAPDDADRLEHELTVLAGESLRPDTPGGSRRRQRREQRAAKQLPAFEAQLVVLTRKLERLRAQAAQREALASGRVRLAPPEEVRALGELAMLDQAAQAQQRQWEAEQWERERAMMRGDHHVTAQPVDCADE